MFHDSRQRTSTSKKLLSVSRPKQPAFPYIAPAILHGSPINLCQISCLYCVSNDAAISHILSPAEQVRILVFTSYVHHCMSIYITSHGYVSNAKRLLVPPVTIIYGSSFSFIYFRVEKILSASHTDFICKKYSALAGVL